MQGLIDQINQDSEARRRGKYYTARIGFSDNLSGNPSDNLSYKKETLAIEVDNGQILKISTTPEFDLSENSLLFTAPSDCWNNFLKPYPPPGFHDLSAMIDTKLVTLSGNPMLWLSNSFYVKTILNLVKEHFRQTGKLP